jgi:uncharacterized membrane protein
MLRIYATATVLFYVLLSFFGVTIAAAQGDELAELAKPLYRAIAEGQYAAAAALGLVLLVALVRRYGGSRYPILSHKLVAPLLVLVASFGAAVASATLAGASVSAATAYAALKVAVLASGGYAMLKPYLERLGEWAPSWAKPFVAILSAIISSKSNAKAAAIKKAEKAGEKAVEDSPAKGIDIDFTDVE